jgi:phosphohistidine phosphatase
MRHAKSEHPPGVPDRDRPLSDRGHRSALAVGRAITDYGAAPSAILTSPAVRARTTAELARSGGGWTAPIEVVDGLYGGGVRTVLDALATGHGRVLVVGHEPTWSMTVETLIGGGSIAMVTAAVACVETSGRPEPGSGMLRWMIHPRLLG